ncbi:MAG: ATP-binding protein [Microbacteriaceae bacterium]
MTSARGAEPHNRAPGPHEAVFRQQSIGSRLRRLVSGVRPVKSWTLRSRLVLAVVALLAVVSIAVGVVSVLSLQGNLMNRLDHQLASATQRSRAMIDRAHGPVGEAGPAALPAFLGLGQTPGTMGALIQDGVVVAGVLDASVTTRGISAGQEDALLSVPADGHPRTVDLGGELGRYRVMVTPVQDAASSARAETHDGSDLLIGLPTAEVDSTVDQLILVIAIVALTGLALAVVAGLVIVRLALRPLDRVAATAADVARLPLDRGEVALAVRVPEADTDPHTEVGRVGRALNGMLGHVASAFGARQASEKQLRQFVADASHELRTPLASIRGYAELTRRGGYQLPEDVSHALGRIESEAKRMTSLVEDLLLLARLDSGRDLDREQVDLSAMLVDAVSDAHAAGPDHRWSLRLPEEPVFVLGDLDRLHQVVVNLLANARTHTPAGTAVTAALDVGDRGAAVITVTDDGPGIEAALLPTLFERFVRGDRSRSRQAGSTGLGLAIVQAVVQAHGGSVEVESALARTVFRVRLPGGPEAPALPEATALPGDLRCDDVVDLDQQL